MKQMYYLLFTEKRNEKDQTPFWLVSYLMATDSICAAETMVDHLIKTADIDRVSVWAFTKQAGIGRIASYEKKRPYSVNLLYADGYHAEYGEAMLTALADLHKTLTAKPIVIDSKGNCDVLDKQTVP